MTENIMSNLMESNTNKPYVVIVDAFSTGSLVAKAWKVSHRIIHLQSSLRLPVVFSKTAPHKDFSHSYQFDSHWENLIAWLSAFQFEHIVCGSEFGVELTDRLATYFKTSGNCPELSNAKRDKYEMSLVLSRAGVNNTHSFEADSVEKAVKGYLQHPVKKVVVKPLNSAGSEDVYVCINQNEVENAAKHILHKTNLMQSCNDRVLVQNFLEGYEYIINSVSANGHHYICDIWKSHKSESRVGRIIYDYEELICPLSDTGEIIERYIRQVLDALKIVWGPAHSELIMTENGPVLLETGARVSGLANPQALTKATGNNQVSLSVDAYANPDKIKQLATTRYQPAMYCYCVNLIAPFSGSFDRESVIAEFERLLSFQSIRLRIPGNQFFETIDLNSSPGVIFLLHEKLEQVKTDYRAIRTLEQIIYCQTERAAS